MNRFVIEGRHALSGEIQVGGSKNAALPIIAATLLSSEKSVLTNVPDIADIHTLISILHFLNVDTHFENNTLEIDPKNITYKDIPHEMVSKFRGSIVLLAPLVARFGKVRLSFPGGCVLGKRPIDTHLEAFEALGCTTDIQDDFITIETKKLTGNTFSLSEMSVTATENAIMAACLSTGNSEIRLAAAEPHVQDLCEALNAAGAHINGIGTHTLSIQGVTSIQGLHHRICSDYLEVGTYAIAAAITRGHVTIHNARERDLDIFWHKMKEIGVPFTHLENSVEIFPYTHELRPTKVRSAVYPSFATDLQAQFAALLTQAEGTSQVFETLFEGKMNYIFELEKMGAKVSLLNNHQAHIHGVSKLKGTSVASLDIRAGAAMVLAALAAEGVTEVTNINYIDRGYNNLAQSLNSLGARITRIDS